jgi:hypothetical protein
MGTSLGVFSLGLHFETPFRSRARVAMWVDIWVVAWRGGERASQGGNDIICVEG